MNMPAAETLERRVVVGAAHAYEVVSPPDGPFDESIAALPEGFKLLLPEQLAIIRIATGRHDNYSTQGSWVAVEYCYDNKTGDILIAKRPHMTILESPEQATDAHRESEEFYIPEGRWTQLQDLAKKDPEEAMKTGVLRVRRRVLWVRRNVKRDIPTNRLAEEAITYFLFGKEAKPYGMWLAEQGIKELPMWLAEQRTRRKIRHKGTAEELPQWTFEAGYEEPPELPFARALWVGSLGHRSVLAGSLRTLYNVDGRVRGVRELPAERAVPQNAQVTLVAPTPLELVLAMGQRFLP